MSARPVVKTCTMPSDMLEAAIQVSMDAIRDNNSEQVGSANHGAYTESP